jgi:signal transduction histidine kinase/CheY-like chemotaxis protein
VDIVVVENELEDAASDAFQDAATTAAGAANEGDGGRPTERGSESEPWNHRKSTLERLQASTFYTVSSQFFSMPFQDPEKERQYLKESWFLSKRMALIVSLYYYMAWAFMIAFYPRPWDAYDYYCWIGISGLFIIPLTPLIIFDIPKRYPLFWQVYLFGLTWMWPLLLMLQLHICHFYGTTPATCGTKDFVGVFYVLVVMPVLAMLALGQSRFCTIVGTVSALIFIAIAIIPIRISWLRHWFNYLAFIVFMTTISFMKEKTDRRIYSLRDQLKAQFKATQKAQIAETRAADSKKRFVSYIFHEVRVPLNTALLSLQNLMGEEVFKGMAVEHIELVDVLQASLGMMEKVLNDVLDFNRMEAGKLMYTLAPFDFGKVIKSVLLGGAFAASAKDVVLTSALDPRINDFGLLIGDEMRLRQILSNLMSNACKFTSSGGRVTISTKLTYPTPEHGMSISDDSGLTVPNTAYSSKTAAIHLSRQKQRVSIRMEVQDTGLGISPQDLLKDRLFSPYVQTEIGKRQGGKGTGLGLALVRNIVELSGGRLGLRSRVGEGSVFWIEMSFGVANAGVFESGMTALTKLESGSAVQQVVQVRIDQPGEAEPSIYLPERLEERQLASGEVQESFALPRISQIAAVSQEQAATLHRRVSCAGMQAQLDGTSASESNASQGPTIATATITTLNQNGLSNIVSQRAVLGRPVTAEAVAEETMRRPSLVALHSSEFELAEISLPQDSALPRAYAPADHALRNGSFSFGRPRDIDEDAPCSVLVVDDDLLTRRLLSRMLTRLGHAVEQAENGLLALDKIREQSRGGRPYDLVLLDNQMPVMTGVELATQLRMEGLPTFVCGCTGNALSTDVQEYLDAGANHVLTKPVMESSIKRMLQLAKEYRNQPIQLHANDLFNPK